MLTQIARVVPQSRRRSKISVLDFVPVFAIGYESTIAIPDLAAARPAPRALSERIPMDNRSDTAAGVRLREACRRDFGYEQTTLIAVKQIVSD